MKRILIYLIVFSAPIEAFSQSILKGTIVDSKTKETLIGANVFLKNGSQILFGSQKHQELGNSLKKIILQ